MLLNNKDIKSKSLIPFSSKVEKRQSEYYDIKATMCHRAYTNV